MSDQIFPQNANQSLIAALVKAQLEIKSPTKDKFNSRFKTAESPKGSPYCSLDSIYEATRLPLASNGLTVSHTTENVNGNSWLLRTTLMHISGESMSNLVPMFTERLDSQGFGSALTYARKYAICSLLGLSTEEDDDGNASSEIKEKKISKSESVKKEEIIPDPFADMPMTEAQVESLIGLIGEDLDLFNSILNGYKVNSLKDIPAKNFPAIFNNISARKSKRKT